MKSRHVEGGYVAEGGQLKALNGQKYIFNDHREGYFLTKSCAILLAALAILAMLIVFLITYFLIAPSCTSSNDLQNDTYKAGLLSNGFNSVQSDQAITESNLDKQINSTVKPATTSTTTIANKLLHSTEEPVVVIENFDNNEFNKEPTEEEIEEINDKIVRAEGWNPYRYRLIIEPNFNTSRNNGTVEIYMINDISISEIQSIVIDIKDIIITQPQVYELHHHDNTTIPIDFDSEYGEKYETFIINLNNEIRKKYYDQRVHIMIKMNFESKLTDTLQGFYKTRYYDDLTDQYANLASTQFSPIDARRAFPCIDRPDKKAHFEISVVHEDNDQTALSNMPLLHKSVHRSGYLINDFQLTPKMPTYLVAFIVSDLVKSNIPEDGAGNDSPRIEIYTRNEVSSMTGYAYNITRNSLRYLQKYFGIRFDLPKIDMVAVPDFGFSAMENWGLITFRESAMLVPKNRQNESSADHTERVASIIAHEITHQWFGNLVTMKWWDDLWLKEGFSTFMSYEVLNEVEPSPIPYEYRFSVHETQKAFEQDSDISSHAISFPVDEISDIRRIFDPISYSKGAALVKMMKSFLGEEAFKAGMTAFLKRYEYGNADQNDLWSVMTMMGHKYHTLPKKLNVKQIMNTWTRQAGYPTITVTRNGSDLIISQHRFLIPKTDPNDQSSWFVPITFASMTDKAKNITRNEIPLYWLTDDKKTLRIENVVDENSWLYLNINRTAYYRVNYDMESWSYLSRHYNKLPSIIRAQIVDDSLNLARTQLCTYDVPLTFLLRMGSTGKDYLSWEAATSGIQYLNYMLTREPAYEYFKAVMRYIGKQEYDRVGFDVNPSESTVELMHRSTIIEHACLFGHDRCTVQAQLIYRQWMTEPHLHQINPNLKDSVYCVSLREGGVQEWYFALKRYTDTTNAGEKEIILRALGCTLKPWLLSKYLNMTINADSGIRKQDGARAFTSVARNSIGYEIAFDFLQTNIKEIAEYFGDSFSTLSKMIDSVTTYMNKDYQLEQFEKFAKKARKLKLKGVEKSINLAMEQVKNNIYWRSTSYYSLEKFLTQFIKDLHLNIY